MKRLALPILAAIACVVGPARAAEPDAAPAELHRGPDYPGAAAFVEVPSLTVVYPAGPGEPIDANRRSAESRARWLASVFKSRVAVAADDQLTEEQKKGHLLLLGWNNRMLGTKELARPFTHDDKGTAFLGIREADPEVDLLVFHRNPLNWSSLLLFWSRIDPERDRFQVLPRVGSDWAMYRNYQVIRQGMFRPGQVWPPVRDLEAEGDRTREALASAGQLGAYDSDHYHILFDRSKTSDADVKAIAAAREAALAKAAAEVGPYPKGYRILLYVYEDDAVKKQVTGVGDPTHTILSDRELHMVRRFARSSAPHEEIHLVAREVFGPCFSTALFEGYALSIENSWKGLDIEMEAALLRRAGTLPALAVLLDEEQFRALPRDLAFGSAGVLMSWIRQTYGPLGVKKIYSLEDVRPATLATALGTTEKALAASFAAWADGKVALRKAEIDFFDAGNEARSKQLVGDWAGMTIALKKALAAKPGDPQTLFNLASAQMRSGDLRGAETTLKALIAGPRPADGSQFLIFGHYQLGRVYDLAGRREEALKEYDAVLSLPDEHGAHDLARERKASPATKDQLE